MIPLRRLLVLVATGLLVGCSARVRPIVAPPPAPLPVQQNRLRDLSLPAATLSIDPINAIISRAEAEVVAGESELSHGRRLAARQRFDIAIDTLLNVPGGARADARRRAEFERLLDRISAHEMSAALHKMNTK